MKKRRNFKRFNQKIKIEETDKKKTRERRENEKTIFSGKKESVVFVFKWVECQSMYSNHQSVNNLSGEVR